MLRFQQDFSIVLRELITRADVEIWYLDECSTHVWEKKGRVWQDPYKPIEINIKAKRGKGRAILGAISSLQPRMVWRVE